MPRLSNTVGERFAGDSRDRRFSRRIHIHQRQNVGFVEGLHELIPQVLRPRVTVRLKKRQQPVELAASRRFQRRANLGRVVPVVIHNRDVVHHALDIETPADTGKFGKSLADQVAGHIQIERHSRGRRGIAHIVNSRRMRQQEHSQILAFIGESELAAQSSNLHVADHQVGLR